MASRKLEKTTSIDAQLRLLAPSKVSDDDKLVEYDALLLDRFLDILQDLHGHDIRETVKNKYYFLFYFNFFFVLLFLIMKRCYFYFIIDKFHMAYFNFM